MLTRKQAAEQRRALKREIDRDLRQKARAKAKDLRAKVHEARVHKKERIRALAQMCRSERLTVRDRLREMRARVLQELRETARIEREAARKQCVLRGADASTECGTAIGRARAELVAERKYQDDLRRIERENRARKIGPPRATRTERRSESDDEVLQNIPHELVALFHRVKRSIKASPRMSRTEAFLKYAEENPGEVFEMIEAETERKLRDLERQHRDAARASARAPRVPKSPPRRRQYTPAELAAVPF